MSIWRGFSKNLVTRGSTCAREIVLMENLLVLGLKLSKRPTAREDHASPAGRWKSNWEHWRVGSVIQPRFLSSRLGSPSGADLARDIPSGQITSIRPAPNRGGRDKPSSRLLKTR